MAPATPRNFKPLPQQPRPIPIPSSPGELPAKYKPAERRVKLIIIALPVALVSSYLLYKRLVLGEEQRRLPPKKTS
ncbi:hypothetical protein TWF694_010218 [Orbilia ellipsospora]|uniref:Uncharacterized protein n=1 Tax=Orbilia ellipsospora TaxID=2528407 RepID=A0AAV9X989_9PEZI